LHAVKRCHHTEISERICQPKWVFVVKWPYDERVSSLGNHGGNTLSNPQYPSQQSYPSQQPYPPQQSWQGEPPLWAPYYGAPFAVAVKRFFKKYATFSGRASRSEYWWWTLVSVGISIILNVIVTAGTSTSTSLGSTPQYGPVAILGLILVLISSLALIVPSLALTVRRLHDSNKSGWMILLGLIPFVGGIILLVFMVLGPDPAGQRFDQPSSY
jgi:uncharacterized membrane protein YhaH (DUF805 family)